MADRPEIGEVSPELPPPVLRLVDAWDAAVAPYPLDRVAAETEWRAFVEEHVRSSQPERVRARRIMETLLWHRGEQIARDAWSRGLAFGLCVGLGAGALVVLVVWANAGTGGP